ncbi:twin-arginine translocase subunit TatC [Halegenticoccus tardaugens]|uniref:twin-arginine translocase subunit TatC n=1 Tax=Halegenticoccus tardaugens TaxID=2071624 RepID=UPI00100B37CF|nr:twin-arginine translocase subunit TatC [Halegenticoccus tardaugens]
MGELLGERSRSALSDGHETAGAMVRAAQKDLRKVFVVFLIGFVGSFYAFRLYVWDALQSATVAGMSAPVRSEVEFIAVTPFDVVLLQAKIALVAGLLVAAPWFIYYAREALQARDLLPRPAVPRGKLLSIGLLSAVLFALGVIYSYLFFFPLLFDFLAGNAVSAGFQPEYSIVEWAEFLLLLTFVFGLAAELPLVMTGLSYTGMVPYATFRERWRHAVVGIVVISSMANGSPDPFSMSLVAIPLVALYGVGLAFSKVATIAGRERTGDPAALNLRTLDAAGVRAAPSEAFDVLSEADALSYADAALEDGDHEKARALLDRFDDAHHRRTGTPVDEAPANDPENSVRDLEDRTVRAGDAFLRELADGPSDDDVGGYYWDLRFVFDSVSARAFRIVATFGLLMAGTFTWLYSGGIDGVTRDFLGRLPAGVRSNSLEIVTLHPVEALVFEMKFSVLVALLGTLPVVAYYAWPALRERGFVRGRRRVIFGWVIALSVGLTGGFALGYAYVAPAVISYLVADAVRADMLISYRISDFFWLVFYTTAGIGLLADVPVSMLLLNTAGVPYRSMRNRWRETIVGILAFAAYFTPGGALTMLLVAVPLVVAYGVGLAALFVLTLGGRRDLAPIWASRG